MAQKLRSLQSSGGPNLNDGAWSDNGETAYFASFSSTSTATYIPISVVPDDTSVLDALPGLTVGPSIMRLQGGKVMINSATGMAVQSTLNLGLVILRNYCALSAQIAAAGGALTSLPVTAVVAPLPSGSVLTITNATPAQQTWTTTAAVGIGATSIPVSSQTPGATYPAGLALTSTAGGGAIAGAPNILFGWVSSASGTPALASWQSVRLPAISANIALACPGGVALTDAFGPYVPELPGDTVALAAFSAGSITVQGGAAGSLVS